MMEKINKIITNNLYLESIHKIKIWEKERIFCKHDTAHFLDVCRLAELEWLYDTLGSFTSETVPETKEMQKSKDRELIYAAGLLHDIGRWQEYETGIRHEIASGELALKILQDCGFEEKEINEIIEAIINHRNCAVSQENTLAGFLYRADKKSRPCYLCEAEKECRWSADKKNLKIK